VGTDHNHLTMEALEKVAERHGLRCLLHEKPFAGFGGSGKHHNWSMVTDQGQNLLDPGKTPHENEVFLIFLCGLIKAIDTYADVLRSTVASPGNDHRLGAMEAPPAIMSMFLGDQLHHILESLEKGEAIDLETNKPIKLGVSTLPAFPKDSTDRNRTSPFAFTGNRFEFRTAGSALSPAKPTFALNTMVADALSDIADVLEKADDVNQAAQDLLPEILKQHSRVLFSGDNYTDEWLAEATKRGLPNLKDTVESLDSIRRDEVLELFDSHQVLRRDECLSRIDIDYERYAQDLVIEARCAVRMAQSQILPRAMTWSGQLAETIGRLEAIDHEAKAHRDALDEIYDLITAIRKTVAELETIIEEVPAIEDVRERAVAARDRVLGKLTELRTPADRLETLVDTELWPFPTYAQMLCLG
jgi:glutamine synthetase